MAVDLHANFTGNPNEKTKKNIKPKKNLGLERECSGYSIVIEHFYRV
jgi:hypothetical protein